MTFTIIGLFLLCWFLIGLISGFICSGIDSKYNGFRFDYTAAFKMSFLGVLLLIWMPFFYARSKKEQKIRW